MSLIKCSECGKQISDKAPYCIGCGCPIELILKNYSSKSASIATDKTGYLAAALSGNADAMLQYGNCLFYGEIVKEDEKQAVEWYKKAATLGLDSAQYMLGYCYENGYGIQQDKKNSIAWYLKSAEQGHASAQGSLAILLYGNYDENDENDIKNAFSWASRAYEQGDENGALIVGKCKYWGTGEQEIDDEAAFQIFSSLAERSTDTDILGEAQYFLGECYSRGYFVKKDINTAIKWYKLASENGFDLADDALEEFSLTVDKKVEKDTADIKDNHVENEKKDKNKIEDNYACNKDSFDIFEDDFEDFYDADELGRDEGKKFIDEFLENLERQDCNGWFYPDSDSNEHAEVLPNGDTIYLDNGFHIFEGDAKKEDFYE